MERGLLWLPLLAIFIGLAWAGWNEYQKVETYRVWAQQFERAKYDIYAVLGQKGDRLTWGKPGRRTPINLQTFSFKDVRSIRLLVDNQPMDIEAAELRKSRSIALEFLLATSPEAVQIPFTELSMAIEWGKYLQQEWHKWHSESVA